ncbi:hypothetical protein M434DRAFT_11989 [Hypoxylon sp. CO27-5]|nr:hypothetical protein M434DRAFT_11989 [Hypoxylon sp. CO27-5]
MEYCDFNKLTWREAVLLLKGDDMLAGVAEKSRVGLFALVTHPGIDKGIILAGLWTQAKAGKAPAKVVYVASSDVEALLIGDKLGTHGVLVNADIGDGQPASDNPITICSARMLLPTIQEMTWDANRTVVVDVHWYPTVEDEILLGHLVTWAGERSREVREGRMDTHVAIILLMTDFVSNRTIEAFDRGLQVNVQGVICSDDPCKDLKIELLRREWETSIGDTILEVLRQDRRVVIGTDDWESFDGLTGENNGEIFGELISEIPSHYVSHDVRTRFEIQQIKESQVIAINPELPYANKIDKLGLVLALGVAPKSPVLNPGIMQVVIKPRELLRCEIRKQWLWSLTSASADGKGVMHARLLTSVSRDELNQREESAENLGPAWNRDFMFLVLAAFENWPSRSMVHMPMRAPANDYVVLEAARRLTVLGCMKKGAGTENIYETTELGKAVMKKYWEEEEDTAKRDFHLAYFLARAQLSQESPIIRRLLARIAALIRIGVDKCFAICHNMDEEKLRRVFPLVIRHRTHAGFVWLALALYLRCEMGGAFTRRVAEEWQNYEGIPLSYANVQQVNTLVTVFEGELGLSPDPPTQAVSNWARQPLEAAQLLSVDRHMMWAWLHRIALFSANPEERQRPRDCVSILPLVVHMEDEPIVVSKVRSYCDRVTTGKGAFYAFYLALRKGSGNRLCADQLTWLPPEAFQEVSDKTGQPWPHVVVQS